MTTSPHTLGSPRPVGATAPATVPTTTATAATGHALARAAGWAALVKGLTYVVGFAVMGAYLAPRGFTDAQGDPAASLDVLVANADVMYV